MFINTKKNPHMLPIYKTKNGEFSMPPWWNPSAPVTPPTCQIKDTTAAWQYFIQFVQKTYGYDIKAIPVGSKLYHGSLEYPQVTLPTAFRYFGTDAVISLWYLNEMVDNMEGDPETTPGYLYEFEVTRPIAFKYLKEINSHPVDDLDCKTEVCVHPQVSFHAPTSGELCFVDLGTEVTIPASLLPKEILQTTSHLKPVAVYKVDIGILDDNYKSSIYDFNPVDAIMQRIWPNLKRQQESPTLDDVQTKVQKSSMLTPSQKRNMLNELNNSDSLEQLENRLDSDHLLKSVVYNLKSK